MAGNASRLQPQLALVAGSEMARRELAERAARWALGSAAIAVETAACAPANCGCERSVPSLVLNRKIRSPKACQSNSVLPPFPMQRCLYPSSNPDADGNLAEDGLPRTASRGWDYSYDGDGARERGDGLTRSARPKGCFQRAPLGRWKRQNRMIAAQTIYDVATQYPALNQRITFTYDSQNRRISKTVANWSGSAFVTASKTLFVYDGWNLLAELDGLNSNAPLVEYAWGLDASGTMQGAGGVGGLLFASISGTGSNSGVFSPGYDGNGNIIAWFNQTSSNLVAGVSQTAGSLAGELDFNPFGETMKTTGIALTLPFGFSTKYLDRESALYYYGERYYNPSTGRWTNEDPSGEQGGLNLYAFCGNDGVNRWDYLGLSCPCSATDPNARYLKDDFCQECCSDEFVQVQLLLRYPNYAKGDVGHAQIKIGSGEYHGFGPSSTSAFGAFFGPGTTAGFGYPDPRATVMWSGKACPKAIAKLEASISIHSQEQFAATGLVNDNCLTWANARLQDAGRIYVYIPSLDF